MVGSGRNWQEVANSARKDPWSLWPADPLWGLLGVSSPFVFLHPGLLCDTHELVSSVELLTTLYVGMHLQIAPSSECLCAPFLSCKHVAFCLTAQQGSKAGAQAHWYCDCHVQVLTHIPSILAYLTCVLAHQPSVSACPYCLSCSCCASSKDSLLKKKM